MARNGTENGTLTAKQEAVAVALATGRTIKETAVNCNAGERTIKRWLAEQPNCVPR
jgi:DNA-binding NarL/FixJ family response regulator